MVDEESWKEAQRLDILARTVTPLRVCATSLIRTGARMLPESPCRSSPSMEQVSAFGFGPPRGLLGVVCLLHERHVPAFFVLEIKPAGI